MNQVAIYMTDSSNDIILLPNGSIMGVEIPYFVDFFNENEDCCSWDGQRNCYWTDISQDIWKASKYLAENEEGEVLAYKIDGILTIKDISVLGSKAYQHLDTMVFDKYFTNNILSNDVKLQWVLVENKLEHVSKFAHLPPKKRPEAKCPNCLKPVIMKLGNRKIHHCAHLTDNCTNKETVLHLNTKFHIFTQLLNGKKFYTLQLCKDCGKKEAVIWLENWDDVKVEYSINPYRPDITILKNNAIIGAIEIFVTHKISPDKEKFFKENKIPWIEIEGKKSIYETPGWTIDKPLFDIRNLKNKYYCDSCQHNKKNYTKIKRFRIVDIYYPDGKYIRDIYFIYEKIVNNVVYKLWLSNKRCNYILAEYSLVTENTAKEIRKVFVKTLSDLINNENCIVDMSMKWNKGNGKHNYYLKKYIWQREINKWVQNNK